MYGYGSPNVCSSSDSTVHPSWLNHRPLKPIHACFQPYHNGRREPRTTRCFRYVLSARRDESIYHLSGLCEARTSSETVRTQAKDTADKVWLWSGCSTAHSWSYRQLLRRRLFSTENSNARSRARDPYLWIFGDWDVPIRKLNNILGPGWYQSFIM